jgi:uncharacterized protein (DUF952 family)
LDPELRLAVRWQDVDLIELKATFRSAEWAGSVPAYVTRDELREFATALEQVAAGATAAELTAGQPDLGFATIRVHEYSLGRRLALRVHLGTGEDERARFPPGYAELHAAAPIERGALPAFAEGLRRMAQESVVESTLPLVPRWP